MIVTIDNNTRPVELYHLSILFQSLAKAHGFVAPVALENVTSVTQAEAEATVKVSDIVKVTIGEPVTVSPEDVAPTVEETAAAYEFFNQPINTNHASIDDAGNVTVSFTPPATDTNLDVNGLPWDARIHAGSRERNTDGSWRVRRRPKGVEEADWDTTLARVTAELTDLMAIPVSPGAVADAAAETAEAMADCFGGEPSDYSTSPLTDDEVDAFVDIVQGVTEPVVVAPPVTIAPPVVVPPVTAVAPPITVDKPAIETFAQLMSWLTSRTPKDEAAKPAMVTRVNEILAANGLTTLQQLGQRADLIPQVLVQFQAAFGE